VRPRTNRPPQQRSLVRAAITLLVQRPHLATTIEPPWTFAGLRQPGIPLLVELIGVGRARPGISTGALLEHFASREEAKSLQKLAVMDFPGGEEEAAAEFAGALAQLERQTADQRREELQRKAAELNEDEKAELRALLAGKGNRT
jgi:DNA primase